MYARSSSTPVAAMVASDSPASAAHDPGPAAKPPSRSRLVLLDGLRGAAALIVIIHHARSLFPQLVQRLHESKPLLASILLFIGQRNVEAVWCFFVLSGFSIRLSIERHPLHEPSGLRNYFYRRARRILPPYWLALVVSFLVARYVAATPTQAVSVQTLLGNLLFLQSASGVSGQWFVPYAANGALWSLSFEAFFYVAYPALVLGTGSQHAFEARRKRVAYVIAVSIAGQLLNRVIATPFSLFLSASFVWYAGVELADRWLGHRATISGRTTLFALATFGLLRFVCGWLEFHGCVVGFLALSAKLSADSRSYGPEPATLSVFAWLGGVSYGLYLLHVPIMRAAATSFGQSVGGLAFALIASLLVAWAAERLAQRIPRA
jgi:peptidoglycan/LPS O-acetylase OafA/YrhL